MGCQLEINTAERQQLEINTTKKFKHLEIDVAGGFCEVAKKVTDI